MAKSKPVRELLDKLAAAEREFRGREFLAPVIRGAGVRVRIAGVICHLRVEPAGFEGWGILRTVSSKRIRWSMSPWGAMGVSGTFAMTLRGPIGAPRDVCSITGLTLTICPGVFSLCG